MLFRSHNRSQSRGRGRSRNRSRSRNKQNNNTNVQQQQPQQQQSANAVSTHVNHLSAYNVVIDPDSVPLVDITFSPMNSDKGWQLATSCIADTGSQVSILKHELFGSFDLQPCFQKVFTANNSQLEVTGSVHLIANFNGHSVPIHALVAKDVRHNLLSLKDCQNLRILQFMSQTCLTTDGQERRLIHEMADYLQQQQKQPHEAIKPFSDAEQMALDKLLDTYQDVVGDNQLGA